MKDSDQPVPGSRILHWVLAARPKTLPASCVPVAVGTCLAAFNGGFRAVPALLCLLFAVCAQIAANFSNDYFDFKSGVDVDDRLGPDRAVASGWISPRSMLFGAILALLFACSFGLGLIPYGGWKLVWVGVASVLFCLLYTAGPFPLSYIGLGDLAVVTFFGLVATGFTYYVQTQTFTTEIILLGLAVGLATDNILVANNYRDRRSDRIHHKYTSVVLFGDTFGRMLYLVNGLAASGLTLYCFVHGGFSRVAVVLLVLYLYFHLRAWWLLLRLEGKRLNIVLELSAKNLVLYGFLFAIACAVPR